MAAPKIVWGASFANTWQFPGAIDNPRPYSSLIGVTSESEAGNRDYWETRDDEEIEFDVRMIPRADTGGVTGYATPTTGVREALRWLAKGGNSARFYPDAALSSYHTVQAINLVPRDAVSREPGGARYRVSLRLRDMDGTPFSEY